MFILLKHKYFQDYYAIFLEINFLGEIRSYSAVIWGYRNILARWLLYSSYLTNIFSMWIYFQFDSELCISAFMYSFRICFCSSLIFIFQTNISMIQHQGSITLKKNLKVSHPFTPILKEQFWLVSGLISYILIIKKNI